VVYPQVTETGWPDFKEVKYHPAKVTADAGSVSLRVYEEPGTAAFGLYALDQAEGDLATYDKVSYLMFKRNSQIAQAFSPVKLESYYDGVRTFTSRGYKVLMSCK
jgi:hypothetical protein